MSVSNVRQRAVLHQRRLKLRQQMAWADGAERAALAQQIEEVERKIAEAEARK